MRTALVTGGTGFIGRHLVAGLLARGVAVRALVRSPERAAHLACDGVEIVPGSLADIDRWQGKLAGCDAVFHAAGLVAARRQSELSQVNGDLVGRLADALAACETPPVIVHISSLAAGGPARRGGPPRDEAAPARPLSAYGQSKLLGERALAERAERLPITVLRPGIVFGPHENHFAAMFQSIQWTRLHPMMGFQSPRLSLLHVADLVPLAIASASRGRRLGSAASRPAAGIYQACDDREFPTHAALGRRLGRPLNASPLILPLPLPLAFPTAWAIEAWWNLQGQPSIVSPDKIRDAIAPSWAASAARARRELNFCPAASLDERLADTARWLRENGRL